MLRAVSPIVSGILFAIGLGVSGMTDPGRVIGFLDVLGQWNPALLFVMVGAISVYASAYWLFRNRMTKPLLGDKFPDVSKNSIDLRLVVGSALFGLGWGITGYCPGPAIVSTVVSQQALVFTAAMIVGFWVTRTIDGNKPITPPTPSGQRSALNQRRVSARR